MRLKSYCIQSHRDEVRPGRRNIAAMALLFVIFYFGVAMPANADPVTIQPSADGSVRDGLSAPKDGIADEVLDHSIVQALNGPVFEDRGIIEFRIDNLSQLVTNATLTLNVFNASGPFPYTIDVFGYAGDGVLSLGDFNAGSLITSFTYSGESTVVLDVTHALNNLILSGADFAGFNFRFTSLHSSGNPISIAFNSSEFPPSATLTTNSEPIPEPATMLLLATGLTGLALRVRDRRD